MPKKKRKTSSSTMKKPSQGEAKPVVIQQAKRVLKKPGKFGKEIEEIFAARIKLRQMVQIPQTNETKAEIAKKKRKRDRLERKNNPGSEPRRRQKRERTELDNNPESEVRSQTTELDNNPGSETVRQTTKLDNNPGSETRRRQTRERTKLDDNNPERKTKKSKKRSGPRKITTEGFKVFREDEIGGPRKITSDGLKVFREDEIGFNKAKSGGTRLCPFDCNCCF
ncbi:PREDICTED: stress response protein nst1-like isoform X2 [Camelina sativa]|nr:PREDICTED: stress response protein nst1-like isoform X2 [Camelina sativa]